MTSCFVSKVKKSDQILFNFYVMRLHIFNIFVRQKDNITYVGLNHENIVGTWVGKRGYLSYLILRHTYSFANSPRFKNSNF